VTAVDSLRRKRHGRSDARLTGAEIVPVAVTVQLGCAAGVSLGALPLGLLGAGIYNNTSVSGLPVVAVTKRKRWD
jgi:hypothetical protein